ncbi:MAG: AI-2E family transporter, partial [Candidatus Pacearchaeota archaeon]
SIALKLFVVLVVFFYGLRDGDKLLEILRESLPFSRSTTNRFIEKSKKVTFSVIYGRIIVGILTGIIAGIGFYISGIKSSLLLSVLVIIASILPAVGVWLVWIPASLGLMLTDKFLNGLFLFIYCGIVVTLFENILQSVFISKSSEVPVSLTLIGIIGGILVFGIFGVILGPLIIAYLSVLFEIYKEYNSGK